MGLTLTKISNIFNVLCQEYSEINFYHYGWRSDYNRNVRNNFDPDLQGLPKYPSLQIGNEGEIEILDNDLLKTRFELTLYFDDLLFYGNDSKPRPKEENPIIQWQKLLDIATAVVGEFNRWGLTYGQDNTNYYVAELVEDNGRQFVLNRDIFDAKNRLITVYTTINVIGYLECKDPLNLDPTTRLDFPVGTDDYEARLESAFSGWNNLRNGTLDVDPIAENIGGGVFQSYQFIRTNKGEVLTEGNVKMVVSASYPYTTTPEEELGTFEGVVGAAFDAALNWNTLLSLQDYFNIGNVAGDQEQVLFDKLLFAQTNNNLNVNAQIITFDLRYQNNEVVSVNTNTKLTLPTFEVAGLYSSPVDISIDENGKVYIGEFANGGNDIVQGFINRFYTSRNQSNIYGINRVGRIEVSTSTNAFGNILFTQNTSFWFAKGAGEDINGFTTFEAPIELSGSYTNSNRPICILNEEVNGEFVAVSGGLGGSNAGLFIYEFNGINFDQFIVPFVVGSVFRSGVNGNITTGGGYIKAINKTLFYSKNFNSVSEFRGITALTYTTDYKDAFNYTRLDINNQFDVLPSLGGVQGNRAIAVDTVNLVNGYPTIYVSSSFHVIIKITANKENPTTTNVDFDTVIFAGQEGVAGNQNGIGTAAIFTEPQGLEIHNGILYVIEGTGSNLLRPIVLATAEVLEGKGSFGVAGKTDFQEA